MKTLKSRKNYLTPTNYLELIMTFKGLLQKKKTEVVSLKARYIGGLGKFSNACSDWLITLEHNANQNF